MWDYHHRCVVVVNDRRRTPQFGAMLGEEESGAIVVEMSGGAIGVSAALIGVLAGLLFTAARALLAGRAASLSRTPGG